MASPRKRVDRYSNEFLSLVRIAIKEGGVIITGDDLSLQKLQAHFRAFRSCFLSERPLKYVLWLSPLQRVKTKRRGGSLYLWHRPISINNRTLQLQFTMRMLE